MSTAELSELQSQFLKPSLAVTTWLPIPLEKPLVLSVVHHVYSSVPLWYLSSVTLPSSVSVLSLRLWRSVDSEKLWNYGTRSISCWWWANKVLSTLTGLSMRNLLLCFFVRNAQHLLASTAVLQLLLPLKAHWKRWGSFVTGPLSALYVQTLKLGFFRK